MIDPSLALQKSIVARLNDSLIIDVQTLDKGGLPTCFPSIIVGEAHVVWPDYADSFVTAVHTDLHIWTDTDGVASVKKIAGKVREVLFRGPWQIDGHTCANLRIESGRYMRDPDGKHSHGVLTVTALLQELVQPR
ncbi:DUF3168 domain-containing protein [Aestuariivirga sp.]|uniref:DUF3168 domain-containing protein n=1 Tax=Aestuariivirga sp. TaxID=2650926 RepID=UPI003BA8F621